MKFGESLNQGVVPEWKDQYLEYKKGKKLIKKAAAAKESEEESKSNDRTPLLQPQDAHRRQDYGGEIAPDSMTEGYMHRSDNRNTAKPSQPSPKVGGVAFKTSMFTPSVRTPMKRRTYEEEKNEFLKWVNLELGKVEDFYKQREQAVYERFLIIEDQLYQLKDHKKASLKKLQLHVKSVSSTHTNEEDMYKKVNELAYHTRSVIFELNRFDLPSLPSTTFLKNLKRRRKRAESDISLNTNMDEYDINYFENRIRNGEINNDTSSIDSDSVRSMNIENIDSPSGTPPTSEQIKKRKKRDYQPKKKHFGVPYLFARKQLKDASLEYYRSLIILRSYKELNRTAFRKITKKFDKANHESFSSGFMEKIDKQSYFWTSDILDKLIFQIEELYISFFEDESNDRKRSLEKFKSIAYALNQSEFRLTSYYTEFFSSGFFLGLAIPLICITVYTALHKIINNEYPEAIYLLQIYAGFFLINLLFLLFSVDLMIFEKFKINYKFIFEFNIGTAMDYKQFWVLPTISVFLLSLICWFSFNDFWPDKLPGRDWPWFFFAIMIIIFIWPFNHFYLSSRRWLQFALWRILWSGFYPVEFRDFFIGDLLCSLTYTMGNISFYFCLYSNDWAGVRPGHASAMVCGSSKSRSMGFFSALPSIWRFLQCVRRYTDTGDWFPHLANMVKYGIGATYYCLLSVYRIDKTQNHRIAFIVMASINSIYCSIWDIVMDWSLLQPDSKNFLLRDNLFYGNPIYYYMAMIVDVLLRFQWVFYVFFSNQIQQSAATSFFIALAELLRRMIWVLFRMENEHCTNVILFRASRDSPLPYGVSAKVERAIKRLVQLHYSPFNLDSIEPESSDQESQIGVEDISYSSSVRNDLRRPMTESINSGPSVPASSMPNLSRRKSTFAFISTALNRAHIKDFQRKKNIRIEDESEEEDDGGDETGNEQEPSETEE